jgi:glucose-6-phosphate isomerase/transaldolase/glucose-6-phosphate isomerase
VAITDPGSSLAETARQRGFRRVFENRPDIGGRYSALSYFGLVPAALAGIDIKTLLDRAADMARQCKAETYPSLNCGLVLGTAMGLLWSAGRDKLTILAPPRIAAFGLWAEQLLAESTGKENRGIIPVGGEPIGDPGVYGEDRFFIALRLGEDRDFDARVGALRSAGYPVVTLEMRDLYDLGAEFFRWEFATAVAGARLAIDPFDEPNVQESKDNTKRILGIVERDGSLPRVEEPEADAQETLDALLAELRQGDYFAVLAYLTPSDDNEAALQDLRVAVRDSHRVATTLGFGPRYLHSTGQLHKGGPDKGVFLQLTGDDAVDVPIPGQAFTFSTLKQAQALGDLQSLHAHGRRARRLHVAGALAATLGKLAAAVRKRGATTGGDGHESWRTKTPAASAPEKAAR